MSEVEVLGSVHDGAAAAARTQTWDGVCEIIPTASEREEEASRQRRRCCVYCELPKCLGSERAVYTELDCGQLMSRERPAIGERRLNGAVASLHRLGPRTH